MFGQLAKYVLANLQFRAQKVASKTCYSWPRLWHFSKLTKIVDHRECKCQKVIRRVVTRALHGIVNISFIKEKDYTKRLNFKCQKQECHGNCHMHLTNISAVIGDLGRQFAKQGKDENNVQVICEQKCYNTCTRLGWSIRAQSSNLPKITETAIGNVLPKKVTTQLQM